MKYYKYILHTNTASWAKSRTLPNVLTHEDDGTLHVRFWL